MVPLKLFFVSCVKAGVLLEMRFCNIGTGSSTFWCLPSTSSLFPAMPQASRWSQTPFLLCQQTSFKIRFVYPPPPPPSNTYTQWEPVASTLLPALQRAVSSWQERHTQCQAERFLNVAGMGWGNCHSHVAPKKNIPFYFSFLCHRESKHALGIAIVCRISCGSQPDDHPLLKSLLYHSATFQGI